ncbi:MAG: hypothetical protein K9J38_13865 [Polynucleobacter sp.]|nr:hypothetical protein [Polynucleobacter sp.]
MDQLFGTAKYSSGDQYVGSFIGGKYDGQGTYTFASGSKTRWSR